MSSRNTPVLKAGTLTEEMRRQLERMGFMLMEGRRNRLRLTLPRGWRRVAEEVPRARWLEAFFVLDAKGRRRIEILYDQAEHRCYATLRVLTRYRVDNVYFDGRGNRVAQFTSNRHTLAVLDAERIIHSTPFRSLKELTRLGYKDAERLYGWLHVQFPRWEDPLAYWD